MMRSMTSNTACASVSGDPAGDRPCRAGRRCAVTTRELMRHLRPEDYRVMPWKNGGGVDDRNRDLS